MRRRASCPATSSSRRAPSEASREADHLAARVAHEHAARRPGRRLKGRKPTQASAEREREQRAPSSLVVARRRRRPRRRRTRSRASVAASPSMLSSRLKAFVIPTSQTRRERDREHVVRRRSRPTGPLASTIAPAADWARELRERAAACRGRPASPATKRSAQPPRMPHELGLTSTAPTAIATPHTRERSRRRCRSRRRAGSRARASARRTARRRAARRRASGAAPRGRGPRPGGRRARRSRSRAERVVRGLLGRYAQARAYTSRRS